MKAAPAALTFAVVAFSLALAPSVGQRGDGPVRPALSLRVRNLAGVATLTLDQAHHEVMRVFATAGIAPAWSVSAPGHTEAPDGTAVDIQILPDTLTTEPVAKHGFGPDHLGYVVHPEPVAFVFWGRIREAAYHSSRETGELLGLVIAHEVGHILLPGGRHASEGIMREAFDFSLRMPLHFTDEEASMLRARLSRDPK
jgi:hypothetical protein